MIAWTSQGQLTGRDSASAASSIAVRIAQGRDGQAGNVITADHPCPVTST